jgi:hypothetical protein
VLKAVNNGSRDLSADELTQFVHREDDMSILVGGTSVVGLACVHSDIDLIAVAEQPVFLDRTRYVRHRHSQLVFSLDDGRKFVTSCKDGVYRDQQTGRRLEFPDHARIASTTDFIGGADKIDCSYYVLGEIQQVLGAAAHRSRQVVIACAPLKRRYMPLGVDDKRLLYKLLTSFEILGDGKVARALSEFPSVLYGLSLYMDGLFSEHAIAALIDLVGAVKSGRRELALHLAQIRLQGAALAYTHLKGNLSPSPRWLPVHMENLCAQGDEIALRHRDLTRSQLNNDCEIDRYIAEQFDFVDDVMEAVDVVEDKDLVQSLRARARFGWALFQRCSELTSSFMGEFFGACYERLAGETTLSTRDRLGLATLHLA